MKNYLTILVLFVFSQAFAQENDTKISLTFSDSNIESVIEMIEEKTDFNFYYVKEWLGEGLVSGSYKEVSVGELLKELFEGTLLNFYISKDNRIILTQYNSIYDTLPEGFFDETSPSTTDTQTTEEIVANAPVFFNEASSTKKGSIETIRIGKENKNDSRKQFTLIGNIKNSLNGDPIADLAIIVKGKKIGAVTDSKGFFRIELPAGII